MRQEEARTAQDEARVRILDAAEELFYGRGVQAVGMDELRAAAGVSLKRLYQCFPAKQDLVEAYLRRRDARWRAALAEYVDAHGEGPEGRVLAVFDRLAEWFAEPDFRGCAFLNSFGELGATSEGVARAAREHKQTLVSYLGGLVSDLSSDLSSDLPGDLPSDLSSGTRSDLPGGLPGDLSSGLPVPQRSLLAGQLALLVDGAISAAAVAGEAGAARQARAAAEILLAAARSEGLVG
ncbi:TetR/AcrR family transcriptional regulator [Streptomyces sp. NRRL S-1448]|uniref:TetR/AcrR family transcriptional regulator n=1 Tax=Streptomyces sp. NRRL S-1448 TaxID=1463883 RepID=UPI0004BFFF8A|nr:TetR/AcrR family transcriptional regulator [Streptomyces sp. NRRL S-1448]